MSYLERWLPAPNCGPRDPSDVGHNYIRHNYIGHDYTVMAARPFRCHPPIRSTPRCSPSRACARERRWVLARWCVRTLACVHPRRLCSVRARGAITQAPLASFAGAGLAASPCTLVLPEKSKQLFSTKKGPVNFWERCGPTWPSAFGACGAAIGLIRGAAVVRARVAASGLAWGATIILTRGAAIVLARGLRSWLAPPMSVTPRNAHAHIYTHADESGPAQNVHIRLYTCLCIRR